MGDQPPSLPPSFLEMTSGMVISDMECSIEVCPVSGMPITVTGGKDDNSYLVSPTRAFIDYGIDEAESVVESPWLRRSLSGLMKSMRPVMRMTKWDQQVQINNWLLSTNPVPDLDFESLRLAIEHHRSRHSEKAIVMRSLNLHQHSDMMTYLTTLGFRFIPNRQIYIWRQQAGDRLPRDIRRDLKLRNSNDLTWVCGDEFTHQDWDRARALYEQLYIEKYSSLNPHYTEHFLSHMHEGGHIDVHGIKDHEGALLGVVGLCEKHGTLSAPIVGYDRSLPIETALYRRLMAKVFERSIEENLTLNLSAGAASFKLNRGGVPYIEYMAVLDKHLPMTSRFAGSIVEACLEKIGIPVMRHYQL